MPVSICAVIASRNEYLYLRELLPYLASAEIDVFMIDHASTDGSDELYRLYAGTPIIGLEQLPWRGSFSLREQLDKKARVIDGLTHDWVIHQDADEWLEHRDTGKSLRTAIEEAHADGLTALNFDEFVFLPRRERHDPCDADYRGATRYYFFAPGPLLLQRAWARSPGVGNMGSGGHILSGPRISIAEPNHNLRHDIGLSQQHLWAKYLRRVFDAAETLVWHQNRLGLTRERLTLPQSAPALRELRDRFDGWLDLYVTNVGSNHLFRNNGDGTFDDVASKAGCDDPRWSTSASFVDYDSDGHLDLYVSSYVDFSVEAKVECFAKTTAPDYCGPDAYKPIVDRLFHNRGDGTFEEVTLSSGISAAFGAGLGVIAADLNEDGLIDLYAANDGDPNQLWLNQGDGTFEDEALLAGLALNAVGMAEASMGVDVADFDGDGDDDVFMTHLDGESNTLYVNIGDGFFEDSTIEFGLHAASLPYTGFGTRFFDYDNDGRLDLLVLNGAVRLQDTQFRKGEKYPLEQPNQLFHNNGDGRFEEVSQQAGTPFATKAVSRGAATGDVDNDGDVDVVVFNNSGPLRLLLNQVGNQNNWLGLRVLRAAGAQDALHVEVELETASGRILWRRVQADGSYASANDPRILFGLGDEDRAKTVRVHWSRGDVEEWSDLEAGRYFTLIKGESKVDR